MKRMRALKLSKMPFAMGKRSFQWIFLIFRKKASGWLLSSPPYFHLFIMIYGFVVPRCDIRLLDFAISHVRMTGDAAAQLARMWPGTGLGKQESEGQFCAVWTLGDAGGEFALAANSSTSPFLRSVGWTSSCITVTVVRHLLAGICVWLMEYCGINSKHNAYSSSIPKWFFWGFLPRIIDTIDWLLLRKLHSGFPRNLSTPEYLSSVRSFVMKWGVASGERVG